LTLLELCLTLLILGLIVALASPRLSRSYHHLRLNTAAERLAGDLRMIQTRAVLSAQRWRVVVWPDDRGYTMERQDREPNNAFVFLDKESSEFAGQVVRHEPLPRGLTIAPQGAVWEWQPDGTAVGDTLRLIDEEGQSHGIRIDGIRLAAPMAEAVKP
jgi:Tfp pilus assembly protein FimT